MGGASNLSLMPFVPTVEIIKYHVPLLKMLISLQMHHLNDRLMTVTALLLHNHYALNYVGGLTIIQTFT